MVQSIGLGPRSLSKALYRKYFVIGSRQLQSKVALGPIYQALAPQLAVSVFVPLLEPTSQTNLLIRGRLPVGGLCQMPI